MVPGGAGVMAAPAKALAGGRTEAPEVGAVGPSVAA